MIFSNEQAPLKCPVSWRHQRDSARHRASRPQHKPNSGVSEDDRSLIADPQTSGGLLIAVPADRLDALLSALSRRGVGTRAVVGDVVARREMPLEVV